MTPPEQDLRISVVVPARNEEALVGACLTALAEQEVIRPEEYEVLLILDHCTDGTEDRAREVSESYPKLRLLYLEGPGKGAGQARRVGMEAAYTRLKGLGRPEGLIASTDADTVVAPDWLSAQLAAAGRGARAIGGRIELGDGGAALPEGVWGWRAEQGRERHQRVISELSSGGDAGSAEHWQFSGASLSLTAETYGKIGGLPPQAALEDEYLERTLHQHAIPIERPLSVKVSTSARLVGRAHRGLSRDLSLAAWIQNNTFDAVDFRPTRLIVSKKETVSLVIPLSSADITPSRLNVLDRLERSGIVDEVVVPLLDSGETSSLNQYIDIILQPAAELYPQFGPCRGYGDALWRGFTAASGEILVSVDLDHLDAEGSSVSGLLGPLLEDERLQLVKGIRSCRDNTTELLARPLINLYVPELSGFADPLSGNLAARRPLLETLSFPVGQGAYISLLLDAARTRGMEALAQTTLRAPEPENTIPPETGEAAYAMLVAVASRVIGVGDDRLEEISPGPFILPTKDGFEARRVAVEERPPLRSLVTAPDQVILEG